MHFQIHHKHIPVLGGHDFWHWTLEKSDGTVVAQARGNKDAGAFGSEREARADIAQAKKSFRATNRCKVLSPGQEPS